MKNKLFLFFSFGLIFLLPEILIVFVDWLYLRLFKKVCFSTCIVDLKRGNFLSECEFTVKANMLPYKIFFIDFQLALNDD